MPKASCIPQLPSSEMPAASGSLFPSGSDNDMGSPGLPLLELSKSWGKSTSFPLVAAEVLGSGFIGQEGSHAHPQTNHCIS